MWIDQLEWRRGSAIRTVVTTFGTPSKKSQMMSTSFRCAVVVSGLCLFLTPLPAVAGILLQSDPAAPMGNHWEIGSGWDSSANERETGAGGPTKLDADFAVSDVSLAGTLDGVGDSLSFNFGSITLTDDVITARERDADLSLTAWLEVSPNAIDTFTIPVTASMSAQAGSVADPGADLLISFDPVLVNFGTSGQFMLDLSDLEFLGHGTQGVTAAITLVSLDEAVQVAATPEPSSFLLLATGALGLMAWSRRRRKL